MKKHLLSFALLAGLATTASAAEYYVIKDGQIATGVEVLEFEDPTTGPKVEETTSPDGEPAVSVTHQAYCSEARFYLADGIDLTKAWNVEIEYFYEAVDSAGHSGGNKWEVINLGLHIDTVGGNYGLAGVISDNTFNVKNNTKANVWNKQTQFVYTPNNVQTVKEVVFGWQRQLKADDILTAKPVYIKTLKFVGEGQKPFFYEDFEGLGSHSSVGTSGVNLYVVQNNTDIIEFSSSSVLPSKYASNPMKCQLPFYTTQNTDVKFSAKQTSLCTTRLYEDKGSDGSEYYDTEILHGITMTRPSGTGTRGCSGNLGRAFVLVPTCGLEKTTSITAEFISKWDAQQAPEGEVFAESADSLVLPFKYAFVDDALEASACDLTLVTEEPLASKWTAYSAVIPFNSAKKYLALVFDEAIYLSYVIDNIRLTSDAYASSLITVDAYPSASVCYEASEGGAVEAVDTEKASAIVSPVPATDVITVNNEGVESVEVLNTLGAVVASANGNEVNVANLPAGLYVVKAYTAEGIATAKIIKK